MATQFINADIKCPFYISTEGNKIRCEGCFKKTTATLSFDTDIDTMAVLRTCCCDRYKLCPQYKASYRKYE